MIFDSPSVAGNASKSSSLHLTTSESESSFPFSGSMDTDDDHSHLNWTDNDIHHLHTQLHARLTVAAESTRQDRSGPSSYFFTGLSLDGDTAENDAVRP